MRWLKFVSTLLSLTSILIWFDLSVKQRLHAGDLNDGALSVLSDSMAAIIMPVISPQPSGSVLLLFNTSVLANVWSGSHSALKWTAVNTSVKASQDTMGSNRPGHFQKGSSTHLSAHSANISPLVSVLVVCHVCRALSLAFCAFVWFYPVCKWPQQSSCTAERPCANVVLLFGSIKLNARRRTSSSDHSRCIYHSLC